MNLLALALFSSMGLATFLLAIGIALYQELAPSVRRLRWSMPGSRNLGRPRREVPMVGREPRFSFREPRPLLSFEPDRV